MPRDSFQRACASSEYTLDYIQSLYGKNSVSIRKSACKAISNALSADRVDVAQWLYSTARVADVPRDVIFKPEKIVQMWCDATRSLPSVKWAYRVITCQHLSDVDKFHVMSTAARYGNLDVMVYLTKHFTMKILLMEPCELPDDLYIYKHPVIRAANYGHYDIARYILELDPVLYQRYGQQVFDECAAAAPVSFMEQLIANTPDLDPHSSNDYAFRTAVARGNFEVANWLVDTVTGVDIDMGADKHPFMYDPYEWHALFFTAYYGTVSSMEYLIKNYGDQFDVHMMDNVAFKLACDSGHMDMIKYIYTDILSSPDISGWHYDDESPANQVLWQNSRFSHASAVNSYLTSIGYAVDKPEWVTSSQHISSPICCY